MKSLTQYILEKFKISKDTKVKDQKIDFSDITIPSSLWRDLSYKGPGEEYLHEQKMKGYMNKGSKPERLVSSIKNKDKLLKRWLQTMYLDWEKAFIVFTEEIVKRGYYTEDELKAYIQKSIIGKSEKMREKYEKFLTL